MLILVALATFVYKTQVKTVCRLSDRPFFVNQSIHIVGFYLIFVVYELDFLFRKEGARVKIIRSEIVTSEKKVDEGSAVCGRLSYLKIGASPSYAVDEKESALKGCKGSFIGDMKLNAVAELSAML